MLLNPRNASTQTTLLQSACHKDAFCFCLVKINERMNQQKHPAAQYEATAQELD